MDNIHTRFLEVVQRGEVSVLFACFALKFAGRAVESRSMLEITTPRAQVVVVVVVLLQQFVVMLLRMLMMWLWLGCSWLLGRRATLERLLPLVLQLARIQI